MPGIIQSKMATFGTVPSARTFQADLSVGARNYLMPPLAQSVDHHMQCYRIIINDKNFHINPKNSVLIITHHQYSSRKPRQRPYRIKFNKLVSNWRVSVAIEASNVTCNDAKSEATLAKSDIFKIRTKFLSIHSQQLQAISNRI